MAENQCKPWETPRCSPQQMTTKKAMLHRRSIDLGIYPHIDALRMTNSTTKTPCNDTATNQIRDSKLDLPWWNSTRSLHWSWAKGLLDHAVNFWLDQNITTNWVSKTNKKPHVKSSNGTLTSYHTENLSARREETISVFCGQTNWRPKGREPKLSNWKGEG